MIPDSRNLWEISKAFNVTTDYLLNDLYESDDDLPKIKETKKDNKILQANLTSIAIILQVSFLFYAIGPITVILGNKNDFYINILIKIVPLFLTSIWMSRNLRYEKDPIQLRKNSKIELLYTFIQTCIGLYGYFSKNYLPVGIALILVALYYIFVINSKYMKRKLVK